jgi:NAD(P)-dependent dehydrogenase (short-subunit alcohol dehydrogenase family)
MLSSFAGKTVVITGGATGIGFGFAKAFGREGARIVIGEPRESRLREAVENLQSMGIEAHYFVCDVSDPARVAEFADFAWDKCGHVDVLLNNAGISAPHRPVTDLPLDDLHKLFGVNFFGIWYGSAIFGKRLIAQGTPAAIYNLGSENSFFSAVPNSTAYMSSKHAVLGLTEGLRNEMPDFITVGLIVPGFVSSEMHHPKIRHRGMDTDQFVSLAMKQIHAGEPYIVTHAHNIEHINARHEAISRAFATYAPRYDGDDEFDVPSLITRLQSKAHS